LSIAGKATVVNDVKYPPNSIIIAPSAHGDFGFEISFTITDGMFADAGLNGNNARLFHISTDGTVTENDRVKRNSDGSAIISISHASVYILSEEEPIKEAPVSEVDLEPVAPAVQDSPIQPITTDNKTEDSSNNNTLLWILLSIAAAASISIIVILQLRRRQKAR